MSWCLGIAEARTRAVIIHDLDALPLDPDLFKQLHDHWVEERADFCGAKPYVTELIPEDRGLIRTYELVLDAAYVRGRFRPFDLFNKLRLVDGRLIDYDTMLHVQTQSRCALRSIDEWQLVHPTQLICHYTDLAAGRTQFRGKNSALPILPYYYYLGGDSSLLDSIGTQLAAEGPPAERIRFLGYDLYIDGMMSETWAFLEKQIRRTEQVLYHRTRPEVESYLEGFIRRADHYRTVGREVGADAVAEF